MINYIDSLTKKNIADIHSSLRKEQLSVTLNGKISKKDVMPLFKLYFCEHPEMVFVSNTFCSVSYGLFNTTIQFQRKVAWNNKKNSKTKFDLSNVSYIENLSEKTIRDLCVRNCDSMHKVIKIFDYLSENISYEDTDNAHDAWGALVDRKAVCEGIAYAFCLLASKCHVESVVVSGTLKGEAHAWNIVNIDGLYYHLDITANLQNMGCKNYDYLFLQDSDLLDYKWNKEQYPVCKSNKHNYFHLTNSYANNESELIEIIKRQLNKNRVIYIRLNKSFNIDDFYIEKYFLKVCYEYKISYSSIEIITNPRLKTFQIKYYK